MQLNDWLTDNHLSAAEFATRLGVHKGTVYRWLELRKPGEPVFRPAWELIKKIKVETDGKVTADDWLDTESSPSIEPDTPTLEPTPQPNHVDAA